jgi:aldose 1-epimerase
MNVTREPFGRTADGTDAELFTLTNDAGCEARITNYGGIVVALSVPDRDGNVADVALGYETLAEYLADTPYFGALVGRYGNRIAKARFTLGGVEYALAANDGDNSLHGGLVGFDKVVWDADTVGVLHASPLGNGSTELRGASLGKEASALPGHGSKGVGVALA